MKKYQAPILEELSLETEDMITASSEVLNGIVAPDDRSGAQSIQSTDWNSSWS